MFCLPQVVAGEKVCIVTVLGTSRGCRNDESHTSATVEQCPIDELSVSVKLYLIYVYSMHRLLYSIYNQSRYC